MRRTVVAALCSAALFSGCGANEEQTFPPGIGKPFGPQYSSEAPGSGGGGGTSGPPRPVESTQAPAISMAECGSGANALYFTGNGFIFSGTQLVTDAEFIAVHEGPTLAGGDLVRVSVEPADEEQGSNWSLSFSTNKTSAPLAPGVYLDAERHPFEPEGEPGLSVGGDGRGCNTLIGSFQIHTLELGAESGVVDRFEATFEQYCEKVTTSRLRGCVRFTRAQ